MAEASATSAARQQVESWWMALRAQGVTVGREDLEAVRAVADALGAAGALDRLLPTVQGVLAKNERDLALLYAIAGPPPQEPPPRPSRKPSPQARRERGLIAIIYAQLLVLATGLIVFWTIPAREGTVVTVAPPPIITDVGETPPAPTGLGLAIRPDVINYDAPRPPPPYATGVLILGLALPFLALAILILVARFRAPAWTRLPLLTVEDRLSNHLPEPDDKGLFKGAALRALSRAMSVKSDQGAQVVDVRRTVEATAGNAGLIAVVHQPTIVERSVTFAVERRSAEDHLSELYFRAADALRTHGADLAIGQYRDDLRRLRDEAGRPLPLPQDQSSDATTLLIFTGDGDALFEPLTGALDSRRRDFLSAWPHRVLLSTRAVRRWGDREATMGDEGLGVAPASSRGLTALAERLLSGEVVRGVFGVRSLH